MQGRDMKLKFSAKSVSYEEALGGDIVQVIFDEYPDDDPLNPRSKNVCASINYNYLITHVPQS
jgi:hypothetical protein